MKKQTFLSTVFSVALLSLTACSNDDNKMTDDGQVNTAQPIEFKVDFADYNTDQDVNVTRAKNKEVNLEQQTVDLGNGILAQCTLQRDTTKQAKPAVTRALSDDTYTMLAYDNATHALKGSMTGTVTSGALTPTSARIMLEPGTYDFILYNSKVNRSGNSLTVNRTDADAALIGRTVQTITTAPNQQYVPFTMKHISAKVKIKLTANMGIPNCTATLSSINSTDIPGSYTYDVITGAWNVGAGAQVSENVTIAAKGPRHGAYNEDYNLLTFTSISNEAVMFIPSTDVSKLKLTFTSGKIYNINMAGAGLTFSPASPLHLEQNGSYILNINLKNRILYLMSDGTTGFFEDTTYGGGSKTPIAIVVSQSQRMGIALKDALDTTNPSAENPWRWCIGANYDMYNPIQTNTHIIADHPNTAVDGSHATSGYDETWNASYSTNNVVGNKVKGQNTDFPPFYAAAHFDPGVTYTGSPALQWYLPSISDWCFAYTTLGYGSIEQGMNGPDGVGYIKLVNAAITQVGGVSITRGNYKTYWTSTESSYSWSSPSRRPSKAYGVYIYENSSLNFCILAEEPKNGNKNVRPFVKY